MESPLRLPLLAVLCLAVAALAADTRLSTMDVTVQSTQSSTFECGRQIALRPMTMDGGTAPDVSYRICDTGNPEVGADGGTCVAVVTDMRLSANTTYDIGVPERSSSSSVCRVAAVTQTGSGVLHIYNVNPRTIPQTP